MNVSCVSYPVFSGSVAEGAERDAITLLLLSVRRRRSVHPDCLPIGFRTEKTARRNFHKVCLTYYYVPIA